MVSIITSIENKEITIFIYLKSHIMQTTLITLSVLFVLFFAVLFTSKRKARPNSEMIDKFGRKWYYLRKTKTGYLFRNPNGRMETLKDVGIFRDYWFK